MNCTACGHTNPERVKFCLECGTPVAARCASCGCDLPQAAKFCGECGASIVQRGKLKGESPYPRIPPSTSHPSTSSGQAQHESRSEPRAYTPKHLAEKILQSKSALEACPEPGRRGERKQVTVLFADVKGSMELAEQLDPEEWSSIMQRFFRILSDGVERFEGFVDKFTGDGIMALCGAPIAHEDHAQRACYAALPLQDELRHYLKEAKALLEELG
jgi:hypothetical protein